MKTKTYYQASSDLFAIAGVIAVGMSDEHYEQLLGKVTFLGEDSKEVQAYLAAVSAQEEQRAQTAQALQDAADEREAMEQLLKEQLGAALAERVAEIKAARESK